MEKIRIYELAKKLKKDSKEVMSALKSLNIDFKSHMSTITEQESKKVTELLSKNVKNDKISYNEKIEKKSNSVNKKLTKSEDKEKQPSRDTNTKAQLDNKKPPQSNDKSKNKKNTDKKYENNFNKKNKHKKNKKNKVEMIQKEKREFAEVQHHVVMEQSISVQELSHQLGKKATEVIMKLMSLGVMATINQEVDVDTATLIAEEFGATIEIKASKEENLLNELEQIDDENDLKLRPAVVTIMGHVDHGKTSLLDKIRKTSITTTEAGGITQQIGAYQVSINGEKITFLDTPGHEAFTAMRARGAQVTDIAILVVAADDGVMPQTIEAIDHAKAAEVPIIVAINKIDKPDANPDIVKQELTQYGLVSEEWGGDTIMVPVSAKQGTGINELLEMILLVAEVAELKANPNRSAKGKVIEAKLDKSRGATATLLVQNGSLHLGDFIIAGTTQGKIRAMFDHLGKSIKIAGPSVPVEILGLTDVPESGDEFIVVNNEKLAKQVAEQRQQEKHLKEISRSSVTLEDLFSHIKEGEIKELNIVLKADTQGAIEAMKKSLEALGTEEVRVKIIRTAVGGIRETDVTLAAASNAIIIGFNVRPDTNAKKEADKEGVEIKSYRIIYEAIDDVKAALSGLLSPDIKEIELGSAEIRNVIKVPKVGNIAGCYVIDGKITRQSSIRVLRDGVVVYEGAIAALKRFKDDVKEVATGYECGISLDKFNDFKEGDIFEAYTFEEIKRVLK